jgi:hypothetical protein
MDQNGTTLTATSVAVSPFNANTVYVTLAGFGTGQGHIWKSTNGGTSWARADGNLPDVPVLTLLVDNTDSSGNSIMVGTDSGAFQSTDGGTTWSQISLVPILGVVDLYQDSAGDVLALTHGAGVYRLWAPPRFVAYNNGIESENFSQTCMPYNVTMNVSPPPGVKTGDILVLPLDVRAETIGQTVSPPTGWTLFNISGLSSQNMTATVGTCTNGNPIYEVFSVASHVYSSSDTIPYVFSANISPESCNGGCLGGEIGGMVLAYRAGDMNFADYTVAGYPNAPSTVSATGAISVPQSEQLVNLFAGAGDKDKGVCTSFSPISGSPALTLETPLVVNCTDGDWLGARYLVRAWWEFWGLFNNPTRGYFFDIWCVSSLDSAKQVGPFASGLVRGAPAWGARGWEFGSRDHSTPVTFQPLLSVARCWRCS